MDAVSYAHSAKQAKRIKRFIENPDSNSGVLTQPMVIEAGETVTIKSGRQAILADTIVDGDLVIEAGGDVFVPAGAGFGDLESQISLKADTSYVDGKYSGFKNYIINGRFDVWQKGNSVNITGGEVRCTDMFIAYSTATTPTASRDSGVRGFYSSLKISGANSLSNKHIMHRIEAVNTISFGVNGNTKITFSLWLKADVNSTVRVAIRVPNTTDTWSSYTTPKVSNEIQITTSWDRYSVTFDLDFVYWGGIALVVYTSTAQTSLWTTGWQLEEGSVATPFENRPYGLELSLCQRYYETGHFHGVSYGSAAATFQRTQVFYKCNKRIAPSVTLSKISGDATGMGALLGTTSHLACGFGSTNASQEWYGTYTASAEL